MKKISKLLILLVVIVVMVGPVCFGHDVELDPENYISFPSFVLTKSSDITITVSNQVTDYSLYYQYMVVDNETYNKIASADKVTEEYYEKFKEARTKFLAATIGTEEAETTKKAMNDAMVAYNEKVLEVQKLVPMYNDSSWIKTTDGKTGGLSFLDNYSSNDKVAFVLWAKLTSGSDTYYDNTMYTLNGTKTSSNAGNDSQKSGSSNKKTAIPESTTGGKTDSDDTVATTILPKTGISTVLVVAIAGVIILAIIFNKKYKTIDK